MVRRIAPALSLFVLAPMVGEFLLGNVSIDALPAALIMAPMYGGGAVLVREVARSFGKGWPTMFLLALAYAVIEEGLVCQTLFNPTYFGFNLLREGYIPALGMGAWWTLFVLTLHTIWSISAPITVIESLFPETTPWLGWPGLIVTSALYALGSALIVFGTYQQEHFIATTPQLLGTVVIVVVLILAAFNVSQPRSRNDLPMPSPRWVGFSSLLAASSFLALRYVLSDWPIVLAYLLLYGLVSVMVVRWSARTGWGPAHRLALAGGVLLAYAWHSFPQTPVIGSAGSLDLVGNAIFSMATVILLIVAWRAVARRNREEKAISSGADPKTDGEFPAVASMPPEHGGDGPRSDSIEAGQDRPGIGLP